MPFKIIITEILEVRRMAGKDWQLIKKDGEYGYTPEIEKTVTENVTRLEQTVETIDLPAVIKAINKL